MNEVSGSVLFCDDIRHEVNGKTSLMGIYDEVIFVDEFPTVLGKFVIHITINIPITKKFLENKKYTILIAIPDGNGKSSLIKELNEIPMSDWPETNFLRIIGIFEFKNFIIKAPGIIQVGIKFDGPALNIGTLHVVQQDKVGT